MPAGSSGGSAAVLLLALLLLLPSLAAASKHVDGAVAGSYQLSPFAGSGGLPPSQPTQVYISVYVDRLMHTDEHDYEFEAMLNVYASWRDPRAAGIVAANAARLAAGNSSCTLPCQLYPQNPHDGSDDGGAPQMGCCDGVWTPFISMPTLKGLSQNRVPRAGINVRPGEHNVGMYSIFHGSYIAFMDLRAFPFDSQRLHIQFESPGWAAQNVVLKASAAGTRLFTTNNDGDAMSGWRVAKVATSTYSWPLCQKNVAQASQPSAPDDPLPLVSPYLWEQGLANPNAPDSCLAALRARLQDPSAPAYTYGAWSNVTAFRTGQPLNVSGFTCTITVTRFYSQWVLTAILPLIGSTWLGLVVFLLPRDSLEMRLGAVLTIFVAQAAIQFSTVDQLPNSSYLTAMQQVVAAGYITLVMLATESVLIWLAATWHQHHRRSMRHALARREYEKDLRAQRAALQARLSELLMSGNSLVALKGSLQAAHRLGSVPELSCPPLQQQQQQQQQQRAGDYGVAAVSPPAASPPAASPHAVIRIRRKLQRQQRRREAANVQAQVADLTDELAGLRQRSHTEHERRAASGGRPLAWLSSGLIHAGSDPAYQQQQQQQQNQQQKQQQQQRRHQHPQPQPQQHPPASPFSEAQDGRAAAGAAAAAAGGGAGSQRPRQQHEGVWWLPWRLGVRARIYWARLVTDQHLADELSLALNKTCLVFHVLTYNLAVLLCLLMNWVWFRKAH